MKLVVSVINRDDKHGLLSALTDAGFLVTVIGTCGGFLREGNATLLVGVRDDLVNKVLEIIQNSCHTRIRLVSPFSPALGPEEMMAFEPIEVEVGGAVVFTLPVEGFYRF